MGIKRTYNVGFYNIVDNRDDETQFDVEDMEELHELFRDFCKENDLPSDTQIYYIDQVDHEVEYDRIMCMSTAHISKESCELLESDDFSAIAFPNPNGFGIIVRCLPGEDYFGDGADDVATCIEYAKERGCGYLRFDRDLPAFTDLPVYDW